MRGTFFFFALSSCLSLSVAKIAKGDALGLGYGLRYNVHGWGLIVGGARGACLALAGCAALESIAAGLG